MQELGCLEDQPEDYREVRQDLLRLRTSERAVLLPPGSLPASSGLKSATEQPIEENL